MPHNVLGMAFEINMMEKCRNAYSNASSGVTYAEYVFDNKLDHICKLARDIQAGSSSYTELGLALEMLEISKYHMLLQNAKTEKEKAEVAYKESLDKINQIALEVRG